jgi:hypothetical protein
VREPLRCQWCRGEWIRWARDGLPSSTY